MWTNLSETIVREFGERASVLRTLHLRQAQWLLRADRWVFLPSLLFSLTSATIQTTANTEDESLKYTSAALAVVAGMLVATSKHLQFSERSQLHKKAANTYAKIYREAASELSLSRTSRTAASELLQKMRLELGNAATEAPLIDRFIVARFMKEFTNPENIALPEVCNGLSRIKVRPATPVDIESQMEEIPLSC